MANNKTSKKKPFYIITGFSGSGKTTALRLIETHGFYCIDNLPATLIQAFADTTKDIASIKKIALVTDARSKDVTQNLETKLSFLDKNFNVKIIFFEANLNTVTKRFKEARLKHPVSPKGTIKEGYEIEKQWLDAFRQKADYTINTSNLNVRELRRIITKKFSKIEKNQFHLNIVSFGFKHGVPNEADIIIDVRCLDNPYFEPRLRKKTGKNSAVENFVFKKKSAVLFFNKTLNYLSYLIQQHMDAGKADLTIAFGCTGGKHRSVSIVEKIKRELSIPSIDRINILHRDIKES